MALLPDEKIEESKLSKETITSLIIKRAEDKLPFTNSFLLEALLHPSIKVVFQAQLFLKDLISDKCNFKSFHDLIALPIIFSLFEQGLYLNSARSTRSDQFFRVFKEFASSSFKSDSSNQAFIKQVISSLFNFIEIQLNKLMGQYSSQLYDSSPLQMIDLNAGMEIFEVFDVIEALFKSNNNLLTSLKKDKEALQFVLKAFLLVRKFNKIKNHYLAQCDLLLTNMFQSLKPDTEEDKRAFVSECVSTLMVYKNDPVSQDFLYEQILNIISAAKPKKDFLVQFIKQHTQEEFIRGALSRTTYKSADVGLTMSDIRNKICKELEIGDPQPFELLVAGNLIDLDVPIQLVYEKVWVPFIKQKEEEGQSFGADIPAMKVVIRISGLDGEATENRISHLVDDSEDEKTVQQRIKLTEVFQNELGSSLIGSKKIYGFTILLAKVKEIGFSTVQKPFLKRLVKLLKICSLNQQNRRMILKEKGVPILLELLLHWFPSFEESEQDSIIENSLGILESVLRESEKNQQETMDIEHEIEKETAADPKHNIANIELCLTRINFTQKTQAKILSSLTRIMSFLTGNQLEPSLTLVNHFTKYLVFSPVSMDSNQPNNAERNFFIERFIEMLEMVPAMFDTFRKVLFDAHLAEDVIKFINPLVPDKANINLNILQDNQRNLSYCVRIIQGLLNGDKPTQTLIKSSGVLDIIYKLADPKIKIKDVGKYCEEIVEYLLSEDPLVDPDVHKYVKDIKTAESLEKKKRAEQARAAAMKNVGFIMKKPVLEEETKMVEEKKEGEFELKAEIKNKYMIQDFREEKYLACITCQEGYINKPEQILGLYTYTKKLRIPDENQWMAGPTMTSEINGFTTVTHFNSIHLTCHTAAAKADRQAKKPIQEWEGAQIRNSHTKCNGWFPIKGAKVSEGEYENGLVKMYQTLDSVAKSNQDSSWLHICDLSNLLTRFARHETFSKETKGGAAEHNLKLIPFNIQLITHILKQKSDRAATHITKLETFMKNNTTEKGINESATFEEFMITLTISLIYADVQTWKNGIKQALFYYMLSTGSNIVKGKTTLEPPKHNIKSKIFLSPQFGNLSFI